MSRLERKESSKATALNEDAIHYPSLSAYNLKTLYDDLLKYSAKHLKTNGRLVTLLPCLTDRYNDSMVPQHTALKLVANSEQRMAGSSSRRLLTYEKIAEEGEMIENQLLDGLNFREEYFTMIDQKSKKERSEKIKKHNQEETAKRGLELPDIYKYKQEATKRKHVKK